MARAEAIWHQVVAGGVDGYVEDLNAAMIVGAEALISEARRMLAALDRGWF